MNIHLRVAKQSETLLLVSLSPVFRIVCGALALLLGFVIIEAKEFVLLPSILFAIAFLSLFYFEIWTCDKKATVFRYRTGLVFTFKRISIPFSEIAAIGHITISRKRGFSTQSLCRSVILTKDGKLVTIEITPQKNKSIAYSFAQFADIPFNESIEASFH